MYNSHKALGTGREGQEQLPWQVSELAESEAGMHEEQKVSDSNPIGFKSVLKTISDHGWPMSQEEEVFYCIR